MEDVTGKRITSVCTASTGGQGQKGGDLKNVSAGRVWGHVRLKVGKSSKVKRDRSRERSSGYSTVRRVTTVQYGR